MTMNMIQSKMWSRINGVMNPKKKGHSVTLQLCGDEFDNSAWTFFEEAASKIPPHLINRTVCSYNYIPLPLILADTDAHTIKKNKACTHVHIHELMIMQSCRQMCMLMVASV